eukprot:11183872-Lingulodinium_polyedra.AAC.1
MCENVVSALPKFKFAMGRAMGMDSATTTARVLRSDARQWTALPRDRILLSALPHVPCSYLPGREWP